MITRGTFSWRLLTGATAVLQGCLAAAAQDFRIADATLSNGRLVVGFPADPSFYYILDRSGVVPGTFAPVRMALGAAPSGSLAEAVSGHAAFYRVRRMVRAAPADTDRDGIDDVWELGRSLDPLDASDAGKTSAGPGSRTWKQVYDEEMAAAQETSVAFVSAESVSLASESEAQVRVRFSKPYAGPVRFQAGGTALPGQDYEITGLNASTLTGQAQVNGTEGVIAVRLKDALALDRDKTLVLSLVEQAPLIYRLSAAAPVTHTLRITEAREALGERSFFLSLTPTNSSPVGPQSMRMAIRAATQGGTEAVIDAAQSTFFPAQFRVPARIDNGTPRFERPAAGVTPLAGLDRTLNWTLSFGTLVPGGPNTWLGSYQIELRGLTAAGRPSTSAGTVTLTTTR